MLKCVDKIARDIMLPVDTYPVIYENETVKRALCKLQYFLLSSTVKRRNLLVLDGNEQPVGWVSLCDLLTVVQPHSIVNGYVKGWNISCFTNSTMHYARELLNAAGLKTYESLEDLCEKLEDIKIKDFVRPLESGAVQIDTSLHTVAAIMSKNNISTLPVVEKGKLMGFIRAEDIIIEMAKLVMNPKRKISIPST